MLSDSFDLPESSVETARKVLEGAEEDKKKVAVSPRHEDDDSKVLLEKGKKKEVEEEREKIIFDPEVDPNAISQPDNKPQKTNT